MFNKKKQREIVKKNICIILRFSFVSVFPRLIDGQTRIPENELSGFVIQVFIWQTFVRNLRFQVSVFRFLWLAFLTPETYINYQCACCPARATFSECSLGKSLGPIYWNHIMFARVFSHRQIENFRNASDLNWKDKAKPPLRPVSLRSLRAGSGLVGVVAPRPRPPAHRA